MSSGRMLRESLNSNCPTSEELRSKAKTMPRTVARRSILSVNGQIGEMKSGEFIQYTNFVFELVSAVSSPVEAFMQLDGFLYKVTTTSGGEK